MQKDQNPKSLAVKPEDAFRMLGIGRNTGWKLLHDGTIPAVRLGMKRYVVPIAALERMLSTNGK